MLCLADLVSDPVSGFHALHFFQEKFSVLQREHLDFQAWNSFVFTLSKMLCLADLDLDPVSGSHAFTFLPREVSNTAERTPSSSSLKYLCFYLLEDKFGLPGWPLSSLVLLFAVSFSLWLDNIYGPFELWISCKTPDRARFGAVTSAEYCYCIENRAMPRSEYMLSINNIEQYWQSEHV